MFDQISASYDRANRFLSFGLDLRWRRALAKHIPAINKLRLLDLATGTGEQIAALIYKKASIQCATGIDLSEKMLNIAREKFANKSLPFPIHFQNADAQALPFADHTFDLCTFSFGIRNVLHPLVALSEMHRVTKTNGRCLILEFSTPPARWRRLYLFYLRHLMPRIGAHFTNDPTPYRYLNLTIEKFASNKEFLGWMSQTGWKNVAAINLFIGFVTLYRGDRF
jgi:demethylmenaquinone methyltransferase / 2-methoxy-6-polyprenyl-1,4-benzoquinol methylase